MAHLVFPRVHQRLLVRVQVQMLQEARVEELVWMRWLPVLLLCKISYCHPTTLSTAPVGEGGACWGLHLGTWLWCVWGVFLLWCVWGVFVLWGVRWVFRDGGSIRFKLDVNRLICSGVFC